MVNNAEEIELLAVVQKINNNPNTSFVNLTTDQESNERGTMRQFVEALQKDHELHINCWSQNKSDPPDMFMDIGEKRLGVEIVILVKPELMAKRARIKKHEESGQLESCSETVKWEDIRWPKEIFQKRLKETINKKVKRYAKNKVAIDLLLIAEHEPALSFEKVSCWLPEVTWQTHGCIKSAYYMAAYVPGSNEDGSGGPKIIHIFGDGLDDINS